MRLQKLLFAAGAGLGVAAGAWIGGCGERPSWAVEDRSLASTRAYAETARLAPPDRSRIVQALDRLAEGHEPGARPAAASRGVRWSDLDDAVALASAEVQMAVVRAGDRSDGARVFELKTVDDRPAVLIVRPLPGDPPYTAEATIGRFGGDDEWAAALLLALDRTWRALGRKRSLP